MESGLQMMQTHVMMPDSLATWETHGGTRNFIRHEDDEVPPEIPVKFKKTEL